MAILLANHQMFVKVISEVVGSVGSSAFNHLVIPTTMIEFIVIKRDAIQGFKEPTVLTAQFVGELSEAQCVTFTVAASLDVLVKPGER